MSSILLSFLTGISLELERHFYINDLATHWCSGLGALYGTRIYQFHDNKRMNGNLETALSHAKNALFVKNRVHGLPAELLPQEVVIVLRTAIIKLFLDVICVQARIARRGWNQYNQATWDDPQILITTTDEVQKERDIVLRSRGIDNSSAAPAPPTQRDLLTTGSGHLAGEAATAGALEESVGELNYIG